jgi:hypothetical protein
MTSRVTVIYTYIYVQSATSNVCTSMYKYVLICTKLVLDMVYCVQANSKQSTGCVRFDINLLKPSRVELQGQG